MCGLSFLVFEIKYLQEILTTRISERRGINFSIIEQRNQNVSRFSYFDAQHAD